MSSSSAVTAEKSAGCQTTRAAHHGHAAICRADRKPSAGSNRARSASLPGRRAVGFSARRRRQSASFGAFSDPGLATQISERLWFGSEKVAQNKQFFSGARITHVLNISEGIPNYHGGVAFFRVPINDAIGEDVLRGPCWLDRGLRFLNAALSNSRARVLVHCTHGISLSPTFVIAFLMQTENSTVKDALVKVRASQPVASPGLGFMEQLLEKEKERGLAESPSVQLCQYMHHSDPATWQEKHEVLRKDNPWFITCPACHKTNARQAALGHETAKACDHCNHEF